MPAQLIEMFGVQVNPHVATLLQTHAANGQPPRHLPRQTGPAADPVHHGPNPLTTPAQALGTPAGVSAFAFQGTNAHAVLSAPSGSGAGLGQGSTCVQPPQQWQQQRHWFTPVELHVFLSHACAVARASSIGAHIRLEARLSKAALAYLWDHRVAGRVLLPAAAMLEMAAAAAGALAQAAGLPDVPTLLAAAIPAPLALGMAAPAGALALCAALNMAQGRVTISSEAEPFGSMGATHFTAGLGSVRKGAPIAGSGLEPICAPDPPPGALPRQHLPGWYPLDAAVPPLNLVTADHLAASAVARVDAVGTALGRQPAEQYRAHPAVLDCATQAGAAFLQSEHSADARTASGGLGRTRVPVGIAAYTAGGHMGPDQAAYTTAFRPRALADGSALGAYRLASGSTSHGTGFRGGRRSGVHPGACLDLAGMLFKPVQQHVRTAAGPAAAPARHAASQAPACEYIMHWRAAQPVAQRLSAALTSAAAARIAWRAVSKAADAKHAAHMRCHATHLVLMASLGFVQRQNPAAVLELRSRGALAASPSCARAAGAVAAAGAGALLRVAAQERMAGTCRHMDQDPLAEPWEAAAEDADAFGIAARAGTWLAPELAAAQQHILQAPAAQLGMGASGGVLVTGGLGDIGALVGAWLAGAHVPHVWLVGHSGRFPAAKAAAPTAFASGSEYAVHGVCCDAGTAAGAGALARALCAAAAPLAGVCHAAGVLADAALPKQAPALLRAAAAPKVGAMDRLAGALAGAPVGRWALFSSLSALLGTVGQGAYAAANMALGAAAEQQQAAGVGLIYQ